MSLAILLSTFLSLVCLLISRKNQQTADCFSFADTNANKKPTPIILPKLDLNGLGFSQPHLFSHIPGKLTEIPLSLRTRPPCNDQTIDDKQEQVTQQQPDNTLPKITLLIKPNQNVPFLGHQLYHLVQHFNLQLDPLTNNLIQTNNNQQTLYNITPISDQPRFDNNSLFQKNYQGLKITMQLEQKNSLLSLKAMLTFANYTTHEYDALLYNEHHHLLDKTMIAAWFSKIEEPCLKSN
jgi:hypothetical protein